jgi:hypothetical protein
MGTSQARVAFADPAEGAERAAEKRGSFRAKGSQPLYIL